MGKHQKIFEMEMKWVYSSVLAEPVITMNL